VLPPTPAPPYKEHGQSLSSMTQWEQPGDKDTGSCRSKGV